MVVDAKRANEIISTISGTEKWLDDEISSAAEVLSAHRASYASLLDPDPDPDPEPDPPALLLSLLATAKTACANGESAHTPLAHAREEQSMSLAQGLPASQGGQPVPPQSRPLSSPSLMPLLQLGPDHEGTGCALAADMI